jgi:hypothetical protein
MLRMFAAFAAVGVMIAGPALAADASAAQLGAIKGSVMVSKNGKMVSASGAILKAGDRIVTQANSSASVKFADGCVVNLKPASMITVGAKSPCASGAGLVSATPADPQQLFGLPEVATAAVAFVVVGAIVVAAANSSGSSTSP